MSASQRFLAEGLSIIVSKLETLTRSEVLVTLLITPNKDRGITTTKGVFILWWFR